MTPDHMLSLATQFTLHVPGRGEIIIEKRGENSWAISDRFDVLDRNGNWRYEPLPSSRTEEFIAETRFTLEDAFERALGIKE